MEQEIKQEKKQELKREMEQEKKPDRELGKLLQAPAVYVVTAGSGEVVCGEQRWQLKKGDYFFLPYAAKGKTVLQTAEKLQVVACLPPKQ